jgi:hypothetical protein
VLTTTRRNADRLNFYAPEGRVGLG